MRCFGMIVCNCALLVAPLAAQDNPFALTGGKVKSAYIVYNITSEKGAAAGASWEIGVAPDRWIMKSTMPFEIAGKKDTMRMLVVSTRDSQYTYTVMGKDREGKVSPLLRPHLAREYAALNAAGKARFRENLKLLTNSGSSGMGSSSDANSLITLTGEKTGSETIGGHKCDVYKREEVTACVVPGAPLVSLRWSDTKQGLSMVAKTIKLNTPLPPSMALLPKGVRWKKEPHDDADFIMGVWSLKHPEEDPEQVPGAKLAKFAVGYLASAAATAELREMTAGTESGASEDMPEDDGSSEENADTSGS